MDDFCYFYQTTGNVIYKDTDLSTNIDVYHDKLKSEMICAKDVYISTNKKIYHKTNSIMFETESVRFLEWKLTKSGEWDWFLVNSIPSNIKSIVDKSNITIDIVNIKQDLINVLNRYNINNLTDDINNLIDNYYSNKI